MATGSNPIQVRIYLLPAIINMLQTAVAVTVIVVVIIIINSNSRNINSSSWFLGRNFITWV